MAGSYTLPQVRVFQEFARTPNDVTQNLNPFLIGPSYQLMRYKDEASRDLCTTKEYAGSSVTLEWAAGYSGSKPDTDWYGVTMADAYVALGAAISPARCLDAIASKGTKFEFTLAEGKSFTGANSTKLHFGIAVKAGDYIAYTDNGETKYTKIREISGGTLASGEIGYTIKKGGADAKSTFDVGLGNYTAEKDARVVLHVAGGKMTWSSNAGISGAEAVTLAQNTAVTLGKGLTVTPKVASVPDGDYVLNVTVVEPYSRDTITVSDLIPSAPGNVTFVRHFDSIEVDYGSLSASDEDGVTVSVGAKADIGAADLCDIFSGTAYLNQRNLRTDHTDGVYTVASDADIIRELDAYVPENPLAYAAHIMLLNSARGAIRYIAVESDDAAGYAKALERASVTSEVYAFCPLTEDLGIVDSIVADCKRLSEPEEKSWRICFCSIPTDEAADVTPKVDGTPEKCRVSGNVLTCKSADDGTDSTAARFTETVRAGDTVSIVTTTTELVVTKVDGVRSNNTLILEDEVADASAADCTFRIVHMRGHAEYVEAIAATSTHFRDRRAYNVFPNSLRASDGNYVPGIYAAAAVCALACSVQPQQPITNVEVNGFSDLPDVYSTFSRDDLNTIAAGGTLILMQEKVGGTVYVRHQISTAYSDGNLNATELSLVKNLDSISYYFANRFAPYTGRYNVSDDLITELRGILEDGLAHLETTTETSKLIGPQILADGTEVRALYRDPDEKDKVYADVSLNLPAPFNNFDLHLQVI